MAVLSVFADDSNVFVSGTSLLNVFYCFTNKNIIENVHGACNSVLRSLQCVSRYSSVKCLYITCQTCLQCVSLYQYLFISKYIYRSLNDQKPLSSRATCTL